MSKLLKLSVFLGLFAFVFAFATTTYAQDENTSDVIISVSPEKTRENKEIKQFKNSQDLERKAKDKAMMNEAKISKAMERKANKLSETRLKVCQGREEKIGNRFKSLIAIGEKTHAGKEKIIERVDKFYTNVLVPAGHTLPNYAALKADIETKEAAVKSALEAAQASGQGFSCDSEDPKAEADAFREDVKTLIAANKAYRTSVRAYVVAVRDLAKQAKADKISSSPVISPAITETP